MPRPSIGEILTKNAAIIGGLVTAMVAVVQLARGVSQSVRDFEWKQAEQGRALVKVMLSDPAWDAMTMLDFSEGRTYEIAPAKKVLIRPSDVVLARTSASRPTNDANSLDSRLGLAYGNRLRTRALLGGAPRVARLRDRRSVLRLITCDLDQRNLGDRFVRGVTVFARPRADPAVQPSEREGSTQPGRRRPARRPSR
jgi:hypothetical protein